MAFDIQEKAILQTRQLLQNNDLEEKVTCVLDSHAQLLNYLDKKDFVRLAIFNLGYLPGSDKKNHHNSLFYSRSHPNFTRSIREKRENNHRFLLWA